MAVAVAAAFAPYVFAPAPLFLLHNLLLVLMLARPSAHTALLELGGEALACHPGRFDI
jgi:hypothetical protein